MQRWKLHRQDTGSCHKRFCIMYKAVELLDVIRYTVNYLVDLKIMPNLREDIAK